MKVEIETLKDRQQEEQARLQIFEMTPTIEDAVALLRGDRWLFEAKNIQTEAVVKLKFSQVMYAEYLERNMFLYTKEDTYSIRISLANFLKDCPDSFVQISKSVVVNLQAIQSFVGTTGGNLQIVMLSAEKLIVNRRYVKKLKEALIATARSNRM